jgi:hypothetical protein
MLESEPDPNDLEDQLENAQGDVSNLDMMKLSCAYVVGAIRAETEGDHENAWVAISHAQYWMGMAYGLGFMKWAGMLALKARSSKGAKTRSAKFDPIRQRARELAAPHQARETKRRTALLIKKAVLAFAEEKEVEMSEFEAERTIIKWIDDMVFVTK